MCSFNICKKGVLILLFSIICNPLFAASAEEIDIKVDAALDRFKQEVDGAERFLGRAKGVLVFHKGRVWNWW